MVQILHDMPNKDHLKIYVLKTCGNEANSCFRACLEDLLVKLSGVKVILKK